ncbi:uncharacterized protein [Nicotiana sylvestris]|uniref:uncharacterized protein n=1 Tax=Nicotiana sylvestris TaxID=4096 RepID=UPI00388C6D6E
MANNNDNTLGNQVNQNQQDQGDLQNIHLFPSPRGSSRQSREGTPKSHVGAQEQSENFEGVDEALQKEIAAHKVVQALVSQLPAAPPTPTPNNNTLENPRSGLVNSGNRGTPSASQEGEPGNSTNSHLQNLVQTLQRQLKEQNDRIEQIPGVPPMIKGVDMDKYSQQPWKPSVAPLPIPKMFKISDIPKYDGTTDPRDHVTTFTTGVKGNDLTKQEIESVLVKKFGETLTKDSFIKAHSGAQKVEKRMKDIFKIKQGDSELLRDFVDRFQRERMTLPCIPDNWAAIAFTSNLNEKSSEATRRLKESLREFPATTWNDVYNRYSKKLRIEEDIVPRYQKEEKVGSRRSENEKRSGSSSRFRNERNNHESRDDDRNLKARFAGYNFNVTTSELVAVLRSMGDKVRRPKEMRLNPNRRNSDHWCEFHNDHDHKTVDCRFLQSEVDHLLKQGHLTELFSEKGNEAYMKNRQVPPKPPSPKRTVNVISGGEDINGVTYTASNKVSKVTVTHEKRVRQVLEEESITSDDEDADGVLSPHNDALVISLFVYDTNVKRVLIDPGSSVNIILLRVLREMQAEEKKIPKAHILSGFNNSSVVST